MKPARTTPRTHIVRAAVSLFVVMAAALAVAAPAQAAAYRFWGYFQQANGAWTFAQTGPDKAVPKDGAVEGWRFAVADESSTRTPRAKPTFEDLCSAVENAEGFKRVALVIDYGRPADSPDGKTPPAMRATCVAVPVKATGSDILVAAKATLRLDKGLTCAIDGWPATSCGEQVNPVPAAAASPDVPVKLAVPGPNASATLDTGTGTGSTASGAANTATNDDSDSSRLPLIGGLVAVIVAAGLGYAALRRSRDAKED